MEYDNGMYKLPEMELCLQGIRKEMELCGDHISRSLVEKMDKLEKVLSARPAVEKEEALKEILDGIEKRDLYMQTFFCSYAVYITENPYYLEKMLHILLESCQMTADELYFGYYQIKRLMFCYPKLNTEENRFLNWKLLEKIFALFLHQHGVCLHEIPEKNRDKDMAVVICEQIIRLAHGPTSTVLDRCRILMERMKKKVLLINTAEILSQRGKIPIWKYRAGTYDPQLVSKDALEYKNCRIPYFQCDNNMPEINTCQVLLDAVKELKPSIVVSIGGSSLFAGLVNRLVPVLCIGLTQYEIEASLSDYQIVPGEINLTEKNLLQRMGKGDSYAIKGRFTFSLREQKEQICRQDAGIREKDFVIGIVGLRLDTEITDEFLDLLQEVKDGSTKIAVIGRWENYEKLADRHPWFDGYVRYLGYCEDVLARMELCDLYVNPWRRGGGTSCVEAMYKGVPVVSIEYGDVAGITGSEFTCRDYDEMKEIIGRYKTDKNFWKERSDKARAIAAEYMDSGKEFERCIHIYRKRSRGEAE